MSLFLHREAINLSTRGGDSAPIKTLSRPSTDRQSRNADAIIASWLINAALTIDLLRTMATPVVRPWHGMHDSAELAHLPVRSLAAGRLAAL